jgi:hypothetical protein
MNNEESRKTRRITVEKKKKYRKNSGRKRDQHIMRTSRT